MKRYITSLGLLLIIKVSLAQEDVIDACEDVAGVKHKKDDSYIGPDGCNRCKCLEGGSACTKRLCPKVENLAALKRSAEANKCVDNLGNLHEDGERYTHVDGCNSCRCTPDGGACTRKLCFKEAKNMSCVDMEGNQKQIGDEAWVDKDGCNKCVCGPLGAVCTEQFCGEHRVWEDNAHDAHIDEFIHSKSGTFVDESGDQPCKDHENNERMPGDTWLSGDGCNVCTCKGSGVPACTKMGCRERLARLMGSGANSVTTMSALSFMSLLIALLLH